jgi:hypothetical protein
VGFLYTFLTFIAKRNLVTPGMYKKLHKVEVVAL